MKFFKGADDAITCNSTDRPRQELDIKRSVRQLSNGDIGHAELNFVPQAIWSLGSGGADEGLNRIKRKDGGGMIGIAPSQPTITSADLNDITLVEGDQTMNGCRFVFCGTAALSNLMTLLSIVVRADALRYSENGLGTSYFW